MHRPFALCWLLCLAACAQKDPAPQLPPETTTGANTAGCKVDGKILVARTKWPTQGLEFGYAFPSSTRVLGLRFSFVDAQDPAHPMVRLEVPGSVLEQGRTYPLGTDQGEPQAICFLSSDYRSQDSSPGALTITRLDSAQHIVAGRFQFTGLQNASGQQVRVTEGRFDFRYQ